MISRNTWSTEELATLIKSASSSKVMSTGIQKAANKLGRSFRACDAKYKKYRASLEPKKNPHQVEPAVLKDYLSINNSVIVIDDVEINILPHSLTVKTANSLITLAR